MKSCWSRQSSRSNDEWLCEPDLCDRSPLFLTVSLSLQPGGHDGGSGSGPLLPAATAAPRCSGRGRSHGPQSHGTPPSTTGSSGSCGGCCCGIRRYSEVPVDVDNRWELFLFFRLQPIQSINQLDAQPLTEQVLISNLCNQTIPFSYLKVFWNNSYQWTRCLVWKWSLLVRHRVPRTYSPLLVGPFLESVISSQNLCLVVMPLVNLITSWTS